MDREIILSARNISMCFNMTTEKITTLKEYFVKVLKKEVRYKKFMALEAVSFDVKKGDVFGILGLNGAGKSTLLKIIAGVMKPAEGALSVKGSIAPLIELGAGFDPELTARENIYLNGAVLGFSKKHMEENFDSIVEFSELHEFIDTPIKNFSSGMYARLGFSIAISLKPDILIVDEILSVGDFKFQEKCTKKIQSIIEEGTTIIFVSHSIDQMRSICNNGIILEKGKVIKNGKIDELCDYYYNRYN